MDYLQVFVMSILVISFPVILRKAAMKFIYFQQFFFNSLNSIHFQIDKTNKEARESLQKFSSMLRYQLYECNADTVPVEKEIVYLQYYVDMQRLRKNNQYQIKFDASAEIRNFNI